MTSSTHTVDLLDGQYPIKWDQYVGQDDAKRSLRIAAKSAKLRGDMMPHILITSPYAGIGKTALALLTVRASGRPSYMVSGSMTEDQAMDMFSEVEDGDVVFWDEFHKVMDGGPRKAEWMLNYLENGVLLTPGGLVAVPKVTIIGATTDKGLILPTILDRFKVVDLLAYTSDEGAAIARHMGEKVLAPAHLPMIHPDVAVRVARAASNQPRRMRDLLMSIRDLAVCEEIPAPADGSYDVAQSLTFARLTEDGLTEDARKYLLLLKVGLPNQGVGEALLRQRLGIVGKTGLAMVERLLLDKDLITHTKTGRRLTFNGNRRANELVRENEAAA